MIAVGTGIVWERREDGTGPMAYYSQDGRWAIFREAGGKGWELCWQQTPDSGYDLMGFYEHVSWAKAAADRDEAKEAARA